MRRGAGARSVAHVRLSASFYASSAAPLDGMPRCALPRWRGSARDRVLHPGRVEGRAPAPGVQPRAEGSKHRQVRVYTNRFQRDEEQAAEAVSHSRRARGPATRLLDHLVRLKEERLRN